MGYGSYSYTAHQALTSKRAALPTQQVFGQRGIHPKMNPFGVKVRECRDSADHPRSLGVVFALDVSGSMGAIPEALARKELPTFMKTLLDAGVESPSVLISAFTDHGSSQVPLQVGQFEATAELMDQWLTWCFLEGGGRTPYESYELALHFFARHTAMDCWEKRGKKGYLFMTGDEPCYDVLTAAVVQKVIGSEQPVDQPVTAVIQDVKRTFHPYFLIPDPARAARVGDFWRERLGKSYVVTLATHEDTCTVAAGLVALGEGNVKDVDELGRKLSAAGVDGAKVKRTVDAITAVR
ncbi:MAG: VWA domain-containing protein [Sandaracinus sp.]|nr:VWA domain-containing protein [Myxococcales bacterium]MCB9613700.1 VWA domain-containing protein [Sandaracinus sp.]